VALAEETKSRHGYADIEERLDGKRRLKPHANN
jgi:hypothetical protein